MSWNRWDELLCKADCSGGCWGRGQTTDLLVLITDPGPDPDDVKSLLIAATLHHLGLLQLGAVIANGGGNEQVVHRAALARCILDHLGEQSIPVGIGSPGMEYQPRQHEYDIEGYDLLRLNERLHDGAELLRNVLTSALPKSLNVVLISSLRDFADIIRLEPELVIAKVKRVAIQGGLSQDVSGGNWRPDESVNNLFDVEAAKEVYSFCFQRGLPMTVTSRNAVPLLPMQLARSFATKTECPVMSYLADAQFLGLEGLWIKLCQGKLPARCDKRWYFQNFCGVDAVAIETYPLDEYDEHTDILSHLNGYVKPYDVVALMTLLPSTRECFPASANVNVEGVEHLLLLRPEHMVEDRHVIKLLRDTYHDVVLATGQRRAWLRLRRPWQSSAGTSLDATPALFCAPACMRLARSNERISSSSQLSAKRDASGVLSIDSIEQIIESALAGARRRQLQISWRAGIIGMSLLAALLVLSSVDQALHWQVTGCERVALNFRHKLRAIVVGIAVLVSLLALHPTERYRALVRCGYVIGCLVEAFTAGFYASRTAEEVTLLDSGSVITYSRFATYPCSAVLNLCIAVAFGDSVIRSKRFSQRGLVRRLWALSGLSMLGRGGGDVLRTVLGFAQGRYAGCGTTIWMTLWITEVLHVIAMLVLGVLMYNPATRKTAHGVMARWAHSTGSLEPLAALVGFGLGSDLEPRRICREAARAFRPVDLDEATLQRVAFVKKGARENAHAPRLVSKTASMMRVKSMTTADTERMADAFIVHASADSPNIKHEALGHWASSFRCEHGREPCVWLDVLCQDIGAVDATERLQQSMVYLARSRSMVVLCGPKLANDLRCVAQLWAWRKLGGTLNKVDVVPVAGTAQLANEVVASLDAFHVRYAWADVDDEGRQLRLVVELQTASLFNEAVRDYTPLVARAASREKERLLTTAPRVEDSRPVVGEVGRARSAWTDELPI